MDAADYTVWRNTLGQSVSLGTGADGTGPGGEPDGVITHLDYNFWKANYGNPMGTSAGQSQRSRQSNVPEPTALALVSIGLISCGMAYRRDRN